MKRTLSLCCALTLVVTASAIQAADASNLVPYVPRQNQPASLTITLSQGQQPTFDPAELELRLGLAPNSLRGASFTRLPPASAGSLVAGTEPVDAYEYLTRDALAGLRFVAKSGAEPLSFTLLPNAGEGGVAATLSYTQAGGRNSPPTAEGGKYPAMSNTTVYYPLKAGDPDGDSLTFRLGQAPAKGMLSLEDGYFSYTPSPAAWGTDRFSFYAMDSAGNLSEAAVVTLKIRRRTSGALFDDMAGSPYAYCAVMLHDTGLMTGEQVGSSWFFGADKAVTAGDALVLLAAVMGEDNFPKADSGDTWGGSPAWLKPYLLWGIDRGLMEESTVPDKELTRAEGVMLIHRALGAGNVTRCELTLKDVAAIPAEAIPAYMTLTAAGVVNHYDGLANPNAPLTRDYYAELLWRLRDYRAQ